jgi:HK97 family phage portal protein
VGLWNWIKGGEFRTSTLGAPSSELLEALGVTASYTGERVTLDNAMELAAVRSAVAMISEAVGGLPLKVYRIMDDDERVEARNHRAWKMLHDKPNEHCTARRFWSATAAQLLIHENSFIYKERGFDEEVESLYHLDPSQVKVEMDGVKNKRYVIEGPPRKVYTAEEVLHIVGFSLDGYYGNSRITQAKQTLGAAIARAKFEGGFYKRGGKFPGTLNHPGRLGEKGVQSLSKQMAIWHGGVESMHKIPVLEEGMKFDKAGMNMEEMQFAELAEQTRTEIAVLFNIPPAYLGATTGDSLTYATTESNQIQFAQMAVLPIADTIAKALSSDPSLLPWNVMYAEFVLESLLRADMKSRAEYWKTMKDVLGLDPEYIASRENIPRDALKEPEPIPVPPAENGPPPKPLANLAMAEQAARVQSLS